MREGRQFLVVKTAYGQFRPSDVVDGAWYPHDSIVARI